jgi:hypothetical protein
MIDKKQIISEMERIIEFNKTLSDEFKNLFCCITLCTHASVRFHMTADAFLSCYDSYTVDIEGYGTSEALQTTQHGCEVICLRKMEPVSALEKENDRLKRRIEELEKGEDHENPII